MIWIITRELYVFLQNCPLRTIFHVSERDYQHSPVSQQYFCSQKHLTLTIQKQNENKDYYF